MADCVKEMIAEIVAESGVKEADIEEINLDEQEIESLDAAAQKEFDRLPKLKELSISFCGLSKLANFPKIPQLECLIIRGNEIVDDELKHLAHLKTLKMLDLGENSIEKIESLKVLSALPLEDITVEGSPIEEIDGYAKKIFAIFPTLKSVDGLDKDGNPVDGEDDDEGVDFDEGDDDEDDEEEEEEAPKKKKKN